MTPEMLGKLSELAKGGATIIASKPQKSPSLKSYPISDEKVKTLADKLWDTGLIKDKPIAEVLTNGTLLPDLVLENSDKPSLDYIHRKTQNTDIYFLVNAQKQSRELSCRFRLSGMQPELWNAETGEITKLVQWQDNGDGTTSISLHFGAQEAKFIVFRNAPALRNHLVQTTIELNKPKAQALSGLEIIKAEYGTFLPSGLVDVTAEVKKQITNNKLQVVADRKLCAEDPAPGYHKELRIEYRIGDAIFQAYAKEREVLEVNAKGRGELILLKAVFGKFESGVKGIPPSQPNVDISKKVKTLIATGNNDFLVNENLLSEEMDITTSKALRVVYVSDGEEKVLTVPFGRTLKLSRKLPEGSLEMQGDNVIWKTPYAGVLNYMTASGQSKTQEVKYVPQPINLSSDWLVDFPNIGQENFAKLISWTDSPNDDIRYFSGTANYTKHFELPKKLLKEDYTLELDLGHVQVIAEVILNGKNLGVLWKAPFRINIDEAVQAGSNTLEVKVTNLWSNRLIGDEKLSLDYKRRGNNISEWPDWINTPGERRSGRSTLPAFNHYRKDSELLPSGLRGTVRIVGYKVVELAK